MSNSTSSPALIFLAPAAAVALVTWTVTPDTTASWDRLWSRFHFLRLQDIPPKEMIPLLLLALVFVPEALASLIGVKLGYLFSSGAAKTIAVTANKGVTFEVLPREHPYILISRSPSNAQFKQLMASVLAARRSPIWIS
jgi:hypothetical protein